MEQQVPLELRYSSIRPKGWYSKFKEWPVEPMSSNMYWNPNEILRFQIQLTNGLMDPYRSHFELTVSTPQASQFPVGGLQVDNSAQSIINQLVVSSNNVEIERITEYDTLAAYLTDIGFSDIVCQRREWEGLGYNNYEEGIKNNRTTASTMDFVNLGGLATSLTSNLLQPIVPGLTNPLKIPAPALGIQGNSGLIGASTNTLSTVGANSYAIGPSSFLQSSVRNALSANEKPWETARRNWNRLEVMRADYSPDVMHDYVDVPGTPVTVAPIFKTGTLPIDFNLGTTLPQGFTYTPKYDFKWLFTSPPSTTGFYDYASDPMPEFVGYKELTNPRFSIGCNEPFISPTIPQARFGYGATMVNPVPIANRTFKLPLLSSVCGVLIPADQFVLIPLKTLYNLLLEFTLNPYGLFSTGYSDIHEYDKIGMAKPIPRSYQISEVSWNLHIYEWPEQEMQEYIQESITKEIVITSSSWMLSAQYQIANGQGVRSNWAISTAAESLGEVVVLFLSNEYMKYPFCRKQFRLSNNIRSMQLKFNTDYYPPQPLVGNAGNPQIIDTTGDNSIFMESLLTSNNYMFTTNIPQPRINSYNFAINERCYNPKNVETFKPSNSFEYNNWTWNAGQINGDTALAMPWIHENRFVGRAAFVYSFEPYGHSKEYMTGVDARQARPFDVIFDTHTQNFFTGDETMYVFTRSNVINVYSERGVRVLGR